MNSNRFNIKILIFLMLFSLCGIISMQVIWLIEIYKIKKEKFDEKVNKALSQVVKEIENFETLTVAHNILLSDTNDTQDTLLTSRQHQMVNDIANDPFYLERILKRKKELNHIISQLYWELESEKISDFRKTLYPLLDSLIKNAFYKNNIDYPFKYAVISAGVEKPEFSSYGFITNEDSYRTVLFPNSVIPASETLVVYFEKQKGTVFKSMLFIIIGTLIFIIILTIVILISIKALIQQKKLSEIKSDFINNMTHEFKTPIATISLATDAIENNKIINDINQIKYYTAIIKEENKRMNMQVENILQMSILDKKELKLTLTPCYIFPLIKKIADGFSLHIFERNGSLIITQDDENIQVKIDETHFCNLISNLIDNAIKYSQGPPEITINTTVEKDEVFISVSDKGIGISRDAQKYIFEKFFREHTGYIHNVKGFGLGLAYSKAIAESFNGRIEVKSKPGVGSIFTVILPLCK